jgi:hypothetical protein
MTKDRGSDSIFDVETAIDVCRQKIGYTDLAVKLAQRYEKWELLVSIYIEQENPNISEAIQIIDDKIKDVRSKVKLLQQYGSQLLNSRSESKFISEAGAKLGKEKKSLDLLTKITKYLILKAKNPDFTSHEYQNYQLESTKSINFGELIKIFVDQNNLLEDFLSSIIERHGDDVKRIAKSGVDIYQKYLE